MGLGLGLLAFTAAAQPAPAVTGLTLSGERFDLTARRGRVVMFFVWSTDCSVCLSILPELRANAQGWSGKPFDLVTLSVDRRREAALTYEQARRSVKAGLPLSLWHGDLTLPDALRRPARLPLMLVIDRDGREVLRAEGRVPPEVWDKVAELLP